MTAPRYDGRKFIVDKTESHSERQGHPGKPRVDMTLGHVRRGKRLQERGEREIRCSSQDGKRGGGADNQRARLCKEDPLGEEWPNPWAGELVVV